MLRIKAYAKINLSLKILGKRPDGYHEIDSLMQSVSLCDVVTLTPLPSGIQLTTTNLRLPTDEKNLAYRAAELFFGAPACRQAGQNRGIKIYLEKNIPVAAGLAGGSADAAAVLYGLNKMTERRMPQAALMEMGAEIGSDVPFCLVGGNCTVRGRGEQVKRNILHATRNYVLVVPDVKVSTKWAYEEYDKIIVNSPQLIVGNSNHLEPIVIKKYPVVQKVKDRLIELGCKYAQMSGSGPGVFGVAGEASRGEKIISEMKKDFPQSYLVQSVDRGVEESYN